MTFRVMIVKKNGQPVGVRAAAINGRTIVLALRDVPEPVNWYDAVKVGIPSKEEMLAIAENFDAISRAFVRAGKNPLRKGWYWSSSEYSSYYAWGAGLGYSSLYSHDSKYGNHSVLPVLAL